MIKFFRQMRLNLIAEGKSSKYLKYAIGEIILVVIGILIALQINNWNQERKELRTEKEIISQLITEFETASLELTGDMKARNEIIKVSERLTQIHLSVDNISFSRDSIDHILTQLMRARFYTPSHPGLTDLQSSGRFDLISSDTLKLYLLDYLQAKDRLITIESQESDFADKIMIPFLSAHLNLTKALRSDIIDKNVEAIKLENLIKDESMGSLLYQRSEVTNTALDFSDLLEKIINDVLSELKKESMK